LQLVVDILWISRPGCSGSRACVLLDVGVRHFVARRFVAGARDFALASMLAPATILEPQSLGGTPPPFQTGLLIFFFGQV